MQKVVITRHPALVEFLKEIGIIEGNEPVLAHAGPEDVAGKHVIGVLPLHLAALAASVTEVPLAIPPELRGAELRLEQVRQFAGKPATYRVMRLPEGEVRRKIEVVNCMLPRRRFHFSLLVNPLLDRVVVVHDRKGEFVGEERLPADVCKLVSRRRTSEGKWSRDIVTLIVEPGWDVRYPAQSWDYYPDAEAKGLSAHPYCPDRSSIRAMAASLLLEDLSDEAVAAFVRENLPRTWELHEAIATSTA